MTPPYKFFCGSYPKSYIAKQLEQTTFKTYNAKNKKQALNFIPIATDGELITQGEKDIPVEIFFEKSKTEVHLVATLHEYELLLPFVCQNKVSITVVEIDFPIFNDIKYSINLKRNYQQVIEKYRLIKQYGIFGKSLTSSILPQLRNKFFKTVTSRCHLDSYFGMADNRPYRECFAIEEERKDRTVIALDVNSMFLHCMEKPFGEPSSLRRVKNVSEVDFTNLPVGLFRVILKQPKTNFIRKYHPFKWTNDLEDYAFEFNDQCEVEAFISSDEYDFYTNHFQSIEVLECFVFDKTMNHPLLKLGMKLFRKKQSLPQGPRKALLKSKLVYLHSVSNSKVFTYQKFGSMGEVVDKISCIFNIKTKPKNSRDLSRLASNAKGKFRITKTKDDYQLAYRSIHSAKIVNSFGFEVIARSRVYMLKLLQRLSSYPDLQICYVNVDSVHISIPAAHEKNFFEVFNNAISEKTLGKLKIEAVSKSGYWLGLGHYYLASDQELNKFKTGMVKSPGDDRPVQYRRILKTIREEEHLKFISSSMLHVGNTFSFKKETVFKIKIIEQKRIELNLLLDEIKREQFLCDEISRSKQFKLELLDRLKSRFCIE